MKRKSLTFLLTVLMSMVGANAYAHNIAVANGDGVTIYYNYINNKTELEVTFQGSYYYSYSNEYTGTVVIPETVTYNEVTYPVTSIGIYAFRECSGLTSVEIPNSVTSIGSSAFSYCSGLEKVIVQDLAAWLNISFGSTDANPLYYAHHLYSDENTEITDLVIPNSVTSIGNSAFYGCSGLTSVEIPNSVTSIGNDTFYGCTSLTSVVIPNSVISIGGSAFLGCSSLTSVEIPNSVTSIGASAFASCRSLTSVVIPNSVTSIGENAFSGCNGLERVIVMDIAAWCNISFGSEYSNPLYYAHHLYSNENTEITDLVIPNSVTSIGNHAFIQCSGLTSVEIPNSVTSIGGSAFYGCSGLTSITIPNSVTSIGGGAFSGCSSLTMVTLHCQTVGSWFNGNSSIMTVIMGNEVTSIGNNAFSGCSGITVAAIPNSVTSIGTQAFRSCSSLTSVRIPNGVKSIGNSTFYGCSSLTVATIPNSVTSIGEQAFYNCSSLRSMTIPSGVTNIGKQAFYNCSNLGSVTIPDGVTNIQQETFRGCSGLTSLTIGSNVMIIGNNAFYGCSKLTSVTIPNSVMSIGQSAFYGCSKLASATIGNGVMAIGSGAFSSCGSLTEVTVDVETPIVINSNTFSNRSNATLYVPTGCTDAYWDADYWNEFKEIKEIEETEPVEVPESVTIAMNAGEGNPREMIGYSSAYALDFTNVSDVRAYIVVGYNDNQEAMLVHVEVVPAYTGIVIKTNNPGVVVDVPTTTSDYYYANLLVPVVNMTTIQPTEIVRGEEHTNFVVGTLNNGNMGFVRVTSPIQRENKSYLRVPSRLYDAMTNAPALGGIGMEIVEDETTGLRLINDGQLKMDNVYYDLNGRRVEHPAKGLYIVNGKKVIVK